MSDDTQETAPSEETRMVSRRQLLLKLGLAASAVYVAPTLMDLDEAEAQHRGSGRRRHGRGSRGSGRRRHGRGGRGSGRHRRRHGSRGSGRRYRRGSPGSGRRYHRGYGERRRRDRQQPELERAVRDIIRQLR